MHDEGQNAAIPFPHSIVSGEESVFFDEKRESLMNAVHQKKRMATNRYMTNAMSWLALLLLVLGCGCDFLVAEGDDGGTGDGTTDGADGGTPDKDAGAAPEEPRIPFSPGPYGVNFRDTAGPFTVETLVGEFDFEASWTGRDSYIFLNFTDDPNQSSDLLAYLGDLWFPGGSAILETDLLLLNTPEDVHYFFGSFDADAEADMQRMHDDVQESLQVLPRPEQAHWQERFHFIKAPLRQNGGWLGDVLNNNGWLYFAVDSSQKMRQLGYPVDMFTDSPKLSYFAHEAQYFSFETKREIERAEEDALVIDVFEAESIHTRTFEVEFPSAEEMKDYDSMELDVSMFCPEHLDTNCGEWDYLSNLYACAVPTAENGHGDTACQSHVAGVDEVVEEMGTCSTAMTECSSDGDCPAGETCDGYIAPAVPIEEIPADTQPCACKTPYGNEEDAEHRCNDEGTGYDDCNCACNVEIARWVTTYGREGRWVTDISPFLAFVKEGGVQLWKMQSGNTYDFDFSVRLLDRDKGGQPTVAQYLFSGGGFNENYNTDRESIILDVPSDTTRAQLVTYITGHGWGAEVENCAEFCNHTHHFEINGTEYVKDHEVAGEDKGCLEQIGDGVVPNQYGTWPLGRAGWCPGLDVKPWVVDVTDVILSGENTISYRGLFEGDDYVPAPSGSGQGFGANIRMASYLIYWSDGE